MLGPGKRDLFEPVNYRSYVLEYQALGKNIWDFKILFILLLFMFAAVTILKQWNLNRATNKPLEYLYSFVDYSLTHADRYSPEKFDLARMRVFAEHLGNPHTAYPIIHVAGTKGKGSVSALCACSPAPGWLSCGAVHFTSPAGL